MFVPERWLKGGGYDDDNKDASNPFSIGPRACIGVNLAYMEQRLILATMIWHFDWEGEPYEGDWVEDCRLYTLWKKPPVLVTFEKVDGEL